jgi:hypothetical protein
MRTTITLEDDVIEKARSAAIRLRTPFREVINEALRAGLEKVEAPATERAYSTKPHKMGLKPGMNLDNIQELLARIEGESFR